MNAALSGQLRLILAAFGATLLTTCSLFAVFQGSTWVGGTVLAVLAVTGFSEAARRLGVNRLAVPLVGALGLLVSLTLTFAAAEAWYGIVPNPAVISALIDLVVGGFDDISRYAAPIDPPVGVRLLAAGGIGLVALAVDHLAVTLRRPALAGLPLLAVYSIPSGVMPGGVGWVAFSLGAAGYLALLLVDARERVTRWGRAVSVAGLSDRPYDGTSPLGSTGRRVGVAAVGFAVLLPVAVPSLHEGLFGGRGGLGQGGGGSALVRVGNPIIDLGRDLNRQLPVSVITYSTEDDTPGYLRLTSLDDFTGALWQPTRLRVPTSQTVADGVAPPVGLERTTERQSVRSEISIGDMESQWLPLPYPVQRVDDAEGDWLWDGPTGNVFSVESSARGQDYTVFGLEVTPTAEQLDAVRVPAEGFERFLELPEDDLPTSIITTAETVTAQASTPYAQAVALQDWLREEFTYDTRAPDEMGLEAIDNFLTDRRGFCIHFASAMAVMARVLNIPSRVTVGFLPGAPIAGTDRYEITTDESHAWTELFFPGVGWTTFEPTPPARTGAAPAYTRPGGSETDPSASPSATPGSSTGASGNPVIPRDDRLAGEGLPTAPAGGVVGAVQRIPWTVAVVLALVLLASVAPFTARVLVRRRRWSRSRNPTALARAAWAEVLDLAIDHGVPRGDAQTHRAFARHLARERSLELPAAEALQRLARAAERAEYARSTGQTGDLRADAGMVRAGLLARSTRRQRLRARLLPASTAALVHDASERTADLLDGIDRELAAVRARLMPRRGTTP